MEDKFVARITRKEVLDDMTEVYRLAMEDIRINGVVTTSEKGTPIKNPAFDAVSKVVAVLIKMEAIDVKKIEQIKSLNFGPGRGDNLVLEIAQ